MEVDTVSKACMVPQDELEHAHMADTVQAAL